jgi:hypothetical protein
MMIFKKVIPRRTFLRGAGVALALPLLDGMVPAMAALGDTQSKPKLRLSTVYVPNGITMDKWTPATEGAGFRLTPILEQFAEFKDRMLVLSGLSDREALQADGEASAEHSRAAATYLTGVRARMTLGKDIQAGISMDQIAAQELGKKTQLASLELTLASTEIVGACEAEYSCAYLNTISWRNPTTPLPMEYRPGAVFERLFGDAETSNPAERRALLRRNQSILDWVGSDVSHFMTDLGSSDRGKMTQYLDSIRDVERRIQLAEEQASRELPTLQRPVGIPDNFEEYAKIMFDLQVLAYQSDLTRVVTFQLGREGPFGSRSYPELGIADGHHTVSHHAGDPDKIAKVLQINLYHAKMFAYFLGKMASTPDGDGSLLDHTLITYGSALSDGNSHRHVDLPLLLVGGGGGQIKGGRHIRYPAMTPLTNFYLTLLDKVGVPLDHLGDSTGKLELLSVT